MAIDGLGCAEIIGDCPVVVGGSVKPLDLWQAVAQPVRVAEGGYGSVEARAEMLFQLFVNGQTERKGGEHGHQPDADDDRGCAIDAAGAITKCLDGSHLFGRA